MIIYNVTTQIEAQIEQEWLQWMQETHLPTIFSCGAFEAINILKIHSDAIENLSYAVQFVASSKQNLQDYLEHWGTTHDTEQQRRFGEKILCFHTQLEVIHSLS